MPGGSGLQPDVPGGADPAGRTAADWTPSDGDLPEAAGRRLGDTAWSSGLSIADFGACAALGLEPASVVQGYAVMQWTWYSGSMYRNTLTWQGRAAPGQYAEQWQCPHGFVGAEHRSWGYNAEVPWVQDAWAEGWGKAHDRMVEEAVAAGAHGVVGVVDDMQYLAGGSTAEFRITGTAVRVPGARFPRQPFTTYLAGQRLAKLLEAGYVPVSVVATLSAVQMFGYCITQYQLAGTSGTNWGGAVTGVGSIQQVNKAQRAARHLARERLRHQLDGDSLHGVALEQFEREAGEGDMTVQCLLKGNRVRRYKDFDPLPAPEPVVRLA
ncbi:MAG TPA: heavy metal-binding domain-containing protein [Acidimicrobiales bacterium]|nr:heavy metal-binding domain-containing protein [Acidimicrobiales bacterium]